MKKWPLLLSFFVVCIFVSVSVMGCKSRQTAANAVTISYQTDISPLFLRSCTPCHFPEKGKKKLLNTYAAVAENIDDIIHRVKLPADHKDFMPFKSKREPLTAQEIEMIELWEKQGMPK